MHHVRSWGHAMLPFKTPNILFSDKSLLLAKAALGAAPDSLSQTKLPGAAGHAGASSNSRFTPGAGSHLGQEQSPSQVLFFTGLRLPTSQLERQQLPHAPARLALTHSRTQLVTQEGRFPLDVAFMLPFWLWNRLKFGFLLTPGLKDKQSQAHPRYGGVGTSLTLLTHPTSTHTVGSAAIEP